MTQSFRRLRLYLAVVIALLEVVTAAHADNDPSRPLRILLTIVEPDYDGATAVRKQLLGIIARLKD